VRYLTKRARARQQLDVSAGPLIVSLFLWPHNVKRLRLRYSCGV
jgi:hypothetical protein